MTAGWSPASGRLLLLAGTTEARRIADALAEAGADAVASLAGDTRNPADLRLPTRVGGFGGDAGFAAYLAANGIGAVLDATHPFAARISARTATVCTQAGIARAQVLRPAWTPGPGDRWTPVASEAGVAPVVPPGARVFLATGRKTLDQFANLAGRRLFCRRIDAPSGPFPLPDGEYVVGRPPFGIEDEIATFTRLRIDWLVVRNAGGDASRSKLDAARALGLPVAMIERPSQPGGTVLRTVDEALAWLGLPR